MKKVTACAAPKTSSTKNKRAAMAFPKKQPCPNCQTAEHLATFEYDHGWIHVECGACNYMGPGEGSTTQAIKAHNDRANARAQS